MKKFITSRLFLLPAIFILVNVNCFALVKIATSDGNWSSQFTWAPPGMPASNDSIIIAAHIYYDVPVTITSGGAVIILANRSLCGQDTFKILCGGYFTNHGTMSGVNISVADGENGAGAWVFAEVAFNSNPCAAGFVDNGNIIIGQAFTCTPSAVNEIKLAGELKIFPNPFLNVLNVSHGNDEALQIDLYDFVSRKLLHRDFARSVSLNTEQLSAGIYLYEVRNKKGRVQQGKVMKK
jgi:type IX secretion system substrate protein